MMEDRITPGLYLEMTELTPDEYAARRVADVLALAEVERATWWINVKRDREDLPRVLPEFDTLGVYGPFETGVYTRAMLDRLPPDQRRVRHCYQSRDYHSLPDADSALSGGGLRRTPAAYPRGVDAEHSRWRRRRVSAA